MECQKQLSNGVVFTVQIRQWNHQRICNSLGRWHRWLVDTEFVPANPCAAARFVNADEHADSLLRPAQLLTPRPNALTEHR